VGALKTQYDFWKEDDDRIWQEINHKRWQTWFAWHPVKVNKMWVWGKMVYRKPVLKTHVTMNNRTTYKYGSILDILKEK
jgi:hypothetical protein